MSAGGHSDYGWVCVDWVWLLADLESGEGEWSSAGSGLEMSGTDDEDVSGGIECEMVVG